MSQAGDSSLMRALEQGLEQVKDAARVEVGKLEQELAAARAKLQALDTTNAAVVERETRARRDAEARVATSEARAIKAEEGERRARAAEAAVRAECDALVADLARAAEAAQAIQAAAGRHVHHAHAQRNSRREEEEEDEDMLEKETNTAPETPARNVPASIVRTYGVTRLAAGASNDESEWPRQMKRRRADSDASEPAVGATEREPSCPRVVKPAERKKPARAQSDLDGDYTESIAPLTPRVYPLRKRMPPPPKFVGARVPSKAEPVVIVVT
ncbi:hypothetical protein B0H10DRAFT_1961509 [Mycena sp. CBHHK59/15]|nr:hypothetical protein B0H10DRAFT_1961509 [Mycena sp. CBHHK59/15]